MQRYFEINENGSSIRCKLFCDDPRKIRKAVIMCHGFGGHMDNKACEKLALRILSKYHGIGIIAFNWPCHGNDVRKKLTLSDCLNYLDLTVKYTARTWTEEIYASGVSFGGYMLLLYLQKYGNPFRKIVLRAPAIRMAETLGRSVMTPENHAALARGKDTPVGFDRKVPVGMSFLEELRAADIRSADFLDFADDILILHGTADEIVPWEDSRDFCDDNCIEFLPISGSDHRFRDPDHMEQANKAIVQFFGF